MRSVVHKPINFNVKQTIIILSGIKSCVIDFKNPFVSKSVCKAAAATTTTTTVHKPSDFVASGKRSRILRAGKNYLSKYSLPDSGSRFDVYYFFPS